MVFLSQAQEEGQEMSFRSLGRVTSFSALNLKSAPPPSPPPPLIISDKYLVLSYCILALFMVCCFVEGFSNFLPEPLVRSDEGPVGKSPFLFNGVGPE